MSLLSDERHNIRSGRGGNRKQQATRPKSCLEKLTNLDIFNMVQDII